MQLEHLLDAATTAPNEPAAFAEQKRKQERLTLLILSSLPKNISSRLTPDNLQLPPYLMTNHILNTVQELTTIDHSLLEQTARNISLESTEDIEEYISKHEQMRIKMQNANFPGIENEILTVQLMIQGIQHIDALQTTHEIMIQTPPQTISEFSTRLHRAANYIQSTTKTTPTRSTYHHTESSTPHAGTRQTADIHIIIGTQKCNAARTAAIIFRQNGAPIIIQTLTTIKNAESKTITGTK